MEEEDEDKEDEEEEDEKEAGAMLITMPLSCAETRSDNIVRQARLLAAAGLKFIIGVRANADALLAKRLLPVLRATERNLAIVARKEPGHSSGPQCFYLWATSGSTLGSSSTI